MFASIDRLTERIMRRLMLLGLASCLALGAMAMGTAALYQWLLNWMQPAAALGFLALVLVAAALVLVRLSVRSARTKTSAQSTPIAAGPSQFDVAGNAAVDAVKADPLGAMLGAGAIGFILESRPDLDHALFQQVLRRLSRQESA
jgi:hypothetical protein